MKDLKKLKFTYVCSVIAAFCFTFAAYGQMQAGNRFAAIVQGLVAVTWFFICISNRAKYNKAVDIENENRN